MNYGIGAVLYLFWDGFSAQADAAVTPTLVFTLPERSLQFTLPARSLMFTLPQRGQ